MIEINGAVALVTGAGRGIGRAVAEALAGAGMRVALVARTATELDAVAAAIRTGGGEVVSIVADLSDPSQADTAVRTAIQAYSRLDVLVNNAGVFLESPRADMKLADWERTLRVNATAPFLLCRAVLPVMRRQGAGEIVNIASTSAVKGYRFQSAYCASKHALLGFSRCLALEVRSDNIRVHTVCPGGVRTKFIAGTYLSDRLQGQAMLEPENVADLVRFLIGQPVNVDLPEVTLQRRQLD